MRNVHLFEPKPVIKIQKYDNNRNLTTQGKTN